MRPFSDNYGQERDLDEDHKRIKWSFEYPPVRTSAGGLAASAHKYNANQYGQMTKSFSNLYIDYEAGAGSTGPPIKSISDMYAEDLEEQLLRLLEEDQEIIEGIPEYPSPATSAGELIASAHNCNVNIMHR